MSHCVGLIDKLSEKDRARVIKTSDMRIWSKLTQSGVNTEEIEAMDRSALLNAMANLVLAGKEGAPAAVRKLLTVGYDAELERQRFEWQKAEKEKERKEREKERQEREKRN